MKKIIPIALVVAATLGAGFLIYKKTRPAPRDEEMIPTPVAHEAPETQMPEREEPTPAPEAPEPTAEAPSQPQGKPKASAGHFEMSRPASGRDESDATDNPGYGKAREKRLWEIFKGDKDLASSIKVNRIHCRVDTCIVEAESKDGDADRFQSLMFALTKQYPWIGNKVDVTTQEGNPRVARFVYFQETPK